MLGCILIASYSVTILQYVKYMLSILNELTSQKELQNPLQIMCFEQKIKTAEITAYDKVKSLTMCELVAL